MFIELTPTNVDRSCKELVNVNQVFSFVELGGETFVSVRASKGVLVEIEVSESYSEILEKLSGGGIKIM